MPRRMIDSIKSILRPLYRAIVGQPKLQLVGGQPAASDPWDKTLISYYKYEKSLKSGKPIEYEFEYPPKNFSPTITEWEEMSGFFQPGMTVCELGPGTGRFTDLYVHTCKRVFLVDFSERICNEILKDKYGAYDNVEVVHTRNCYLPDVMAASVDLFFGFGVFPHLCMEQFVGYMSEAMRVLKPGGKMMIEYLSLSGDLGWKKFLGRIPGDYSRSIFCYQSTPELERIAQRIGYAVIRSIIDKNNLHGSYLVLEKPKSASVPENFSIRDYAAPYVPGVQLQEMYSATGIAQPLDFNAAERKQPE